VTACANCTRPIAGKGSRSVATGGRGDPIVCCMACGNELAHRIVAGVPGVLALLPPDDRAKWRDYKDGAPSRVKPR
jgi:hypothetical protein